MPLTYTSTIEEVREAYYANLDYGVGLGDAREFRRAASLLLEMIPSRSSNKDGDIEMNLDHIRTQLKAVEDFISNTSVPTVAAPPRRIKYLNPVRG